MWRGQTPINPNVMAYPRICPNIRRWEYLFNGMDPTGQLEFIWLFKAFDV